MGFNRSTQSGRKILTLGEGFTTQVVTLWCFNTVTLKLKVNKKGVSKGRYTLGPGSAFCGEGWPSASPAVIPCLPVGTTLEGTLRSTRPTLLRDTLTLKPLRLKDSHR